MKSFRNASIQRQQTIVIMLTCSVALLLACTAFVVYEILTFRAEMTRNLSTLAEIIGNNSTAALDFNEEKAAAETLAALRAEPNIVAACIYAKNGKVFARYSRAGKKEFLPPKMRFDGHEFKDDQLLLFKPVTFKGDRIGAVCLEADLHALSERLQEYGLIVAGVLLAASLVAFVLSSRLQRLISEPLLRLARTARAVAVEKDYSVRAQKQNEDEMGQLIDGFNDMLDQIQQRDRALQQAHDGLDLRVQQRTAELSKANEQLNLEFAERKRTEQRLLTQHRVTLVLARAATLQEASAHILETICQSVQWDAGAVWAVDRSANPLRCVEVWHRPGIDLEELEGYTRKRAFPPGIGLPGRVWSEGASAWAGEAVGDPTCARADLASKARLNEAFAFPIQSSG